MNCKVLNYDEYSADRKKAMAEIGMKPADIPAHKGETMKQELKEQMANEIIEYLEGKGVADADKRKVFSNAYSKIALKTGPVQKKDKPAKKK